VADPEAFLGSVGNLELNVCLQRANRELALHHVGLRAKKLAPK
jgi:hypothetical protein